MKTFKLNSLTVLESYNNMFKEHPIELIDGLIINREDEHGQWLTEAYCDKKYKDLLIRLSESQDSIIINVKITKENNTPVTFKTSIIGINDIGDSMNMLFMGEMVDKDKWAMEDLLKSLLDKGYESDELLERFKELM